MTRRGRCSCGAVRFGIDGPVRDVIVCHCDACREAAGAPWGASAVRREDLAVDDPGAVEWRPAAVSACGARRGFCRTCGGYLFWDAPGRETVSFAAASIGGDGRDLAVAAHIWVPEAERGALAAAGLPVAPEGLPEAVRVPWHETRGRRER